MIDSKKLEYFVAVAEELHFGRAAERVGIAQPPMSRQIQALEEEMKTMLFVRGRSSISLTQAGERFYERVVGIMEDLADAQIEARRIAQGAEGRLRIGFVGSASYGILPNIIKSFRHHYKDVALSMAPMNNSGLKRALVRHEIDVAIARPAIKDHEVISINLITEPLILAVPDTDPLSGKEQVSPQELGDSTLVLYPERPRPSFADHVIEIMTNAGVELDRRVFTMDFQSAIAMVSVSEGISVVPASVGENARRGVQFVKLDAPGATTSLSINFRIDNQSIFVHNFSKIAAQVARRTLR